jgi:hypothetical protein
MMMMPIDPKFLTAREVQERFRLKRIQSVYALPIRKHRIGRFVRYKLADVEAYENRPYEGGRRSA